MNASDLQKAIDAIQKVQQSGGCLFIFTGAGMSMYSGVPVFRNSDGTMSPEFITHLYNFNQARRQAGLQPAEDWFQFSTPAMFDSRTSKEAWQYWRWRILRAQVCPASDYHDLMKIVSFFGEDKCFVKTSNCDSLHIKAGMPEASVEEIHGALRHMQCSDRCTANISTVDSSFLTHLELDESWIPTCDNCLKCLRPNVVIFNDNKISMKGLNEQYERFSRFQKLFEVGQRQVNGIVLEIGAGVVVSSIRHGAEQLGALCLGGLVRINPSSEECEKNETSHDLTGKYFPLVSTGTLALSKLVGGLNLNKPDCKPMPLQ